MDIILFKIVMPLTIVYTVLLQLPVDQLQFLEIAKDLSGASLAVVVLAWVGWYFKRLYAQERTANKILEDKMTEALREVKESNQKVFDKLDRLNESILTRLKD